MTLGRWRAALIAITWALSVSTAAAQACPFGISPHSAQRLFDALQQSSVGPGYRFEGLRTEARDFFILWSHAGEPCPPLRGHIDTCWSTLGLPRFVLDPVADPPGACPELRPAMQGLLATQAGAVGIDRQLLISAAWALAWLIFAVLLFGGWRLRLEHRLHLIAPLALVTTSAGLHWLFSELAPGDLHLNLAAIWSDAPEWRWGPAPIELLRVAGWMWGGLRDVDIRWINLSLSGAVALLLYSIARRVGIGRGAAFAGAAIASAHPLFLATGGALERQPIYLFAASGSLLLLVRYLQDGRSGDLAAFVLGSVLATSSRPEGAHVLVLELAALVTVRAPARRRLLGVAAWLTLGVAAFVYIRLVVGSTAPGGQWFLGELPFAWSILADPDFLPLGWLPLWVAGILLALRQRAGWLALLSLVGLDLIWRVSGIYPMFVDYPRQVASARYESILLIPFAIAVALLAERIRRLRPALVVAAVVTLVVLTAASWSRPAAVLLTPFTVDYEYRFLRQQAAALPADALLYVLDAPLDDIGFIDAHLVGQFAGSPVPFRPWSERNCGELARRVAPTFLYIGSSCADLVSLPNRELGGDYRQWMRDCGAVRSLVQADLVEQRDVPAHKMSWHDLRDPTVTLAIYRLRDRAICDLDFPARPQVRPHNESRS